VAKDRLKVKTDGADRIETPDGVRLDPAKGLAIIDVDEVLALFVQGFDRFLRTRGYQWRMDSFALFANIYAGEAQRPVDAAVGRDLFDAFFADGCGALEPAPGAAEGLARLSAAGQVVILTNAPETARALRGDWLKRHGMDYPMILSRGLKGGPVSALAARVKGPVMFVDDLLPNLDSVAEAAPQVERFQMVADPRLRRLAPSAPDRHPLIEDWTDLARIGAALLAA
jgi:phosphoglycolate phosphatase-like HAD superfamily hydrolase